jgi:hypothetical protein
MKIIWCSQAFNSENFMSMCLNSEYQAGTHWFSIEQYGARTAYSVFAANMGSG